MPRPNSLDPQQIGFTPRPAVPWLGPVLLAGTAVRVLLAELFGAYLDKRELQSALPAQSYRHQADPATGELWLDFVADLGDSFNATYSVAFLAAQPGLFVDGHQTRRGDLLIMGGDQVYPTASSQAYEDRSKGPYRAALPACPQDGRPQPTLYAIPGNHDWYDGLTAFLRIFAQAGNGNIGGWQTQQSRSYFAVELPHRWWLYGIDVQFDAYLDDPQLNYFRHMATQLRPGDRVILCAPAPTWVKAAEHPKAYDTIDYFLRTIVDPTGATVPLMIAGDSHHYARYSSPERQLITCGGGGAYLAATHNLPERLTVPPKQSLVRRASPSREYVLAHAYPTKARSRALAWGVFRLPSRNPGFAALLGTLHTLLMLALAGAMHDTTSTDKRLVTIPVAVMVAVMLGATALFAMPPSAGGRRPRHWAFGLGHGLVHIGLALAGTWLWLRLPFVDLPWPVPIGAAAIVYGPISALAGSLVVSGYLLVASLADVNVNELFAAQGIEHLKSFLRLRIGPDGSLVVFPIAVDRVAHKWQAQPQAPAETSWFAPAEPMPIHLAEPPFILR